MEFILGSARCVRIKPRIVPKSKKKWKLPILIPRRKVLNLRVLDRSSKTVENVTLDAANWQISSGPVTLGTKECLLYKSEV